MPNTPAKDKQGAENNLIADNLVDAKNECHKAISEALEAHGAAIDKQIAPAIRRGQVDIEESLEVSKTLQDAIIFALRRYVRTVTCHEISVLMYKRQHTS